MSGTQLLMPRVDAWAGRRSHTSERQAPISAEARRGTRARAEKRWRAGGGVAREREGVVRERGAWQ